MKLETSSFITIHGKRYGYSKEDMVSLNENLNKKIDHVKKSLITGLCEQ
jgi:hypothetical protein